MKYVISYNNPLTHCVDISLEINDISSDSIQIHLPSWRPGRYEIANFAKNILKIEAVDHNGNQLGINKVSKDSWVVDSSKNTHLIINYTYFAFKMDAGNSWLDDEQLYLNFINCMVYVQERIDDPCIVELELPDDYHIATGLFEKQKNVLVADSYYHLVDSPMIASSHLDHHQYMVENTNFHIWINGPHQINTAQMIHDFEKISKSQINMIGDFPCEDYHFLIQALPYKHYHGVEHWNSTTITLGPANELNDAPLYQALLGISSHELFHTWNVIRIRPKEMLPYDFSKENYFDTGYVAEGFTTYYGDLFLVRSGVLDIDWYLSKVNKMLRGHFENFGRSNMSVAASSVDLWLDGYVTGTPNRKVSIYNEGALIALILDLQIRVSSAHSKSLDDVVRLLWVEFGKPGIGYSSKNIIDILNEYTTLDWKGFMDNFIYGTNPIDKLLASLLDKFGCNLQVMQASLKNESHWGFRVNEENCIIKIHPKSLAEKKLSIGDYVLNLSKVIESGLNEIKLKVKRNHREIDVELTSTDQRYFEYYQVHQTANRSVKQKNAFQKWLLE
jgi:predicted metalloprotease with PDZ domain